MRWEVEVNGDKLVAGPAQELTELLALSADNIKEGRGYLCVVDLRRGLEIGDKPADRLKELGVRYVHVPVTVETFSEQDMDCVRREFARHWGRVLVISAEGARAVFFALAHAARAQAWTADQATASCSVLSQKPAWVEHLKPYLARHARTVNA